MNNYIYLAIYGRSLRKIQNWESSLVDPDKSFVNRKLTSQNANGALFQSETFHYLLFKTVIFVL